MFLKTLGIPPQSGTFIISEPWQVCGLTDWLGVMFSLSFDVFIALERKYVWDAYASAGKGDDNNIAIPETLLR